MSVRVPVRMSAKMARSHRWFTIVGFVGTNVVASGPTGRMLELSSLTLEPDDDSAVFHHHRGEPFSAGQPLQFRDSVPLLGNVDLNKVDFALTVVHLGRR